MKKRTEKVSQWELIVLAAVAIGLFALLNSAKQTVKAGDYEVKRAAALRCAQAFAEIRTQREQLGLGVDEINDPNRTGLIGAQFSLITAGRGDLTGALTATNPNFVAVAMTLLRKAGLRTGDIVAVGLDGTLPALNIEVLVACQALGIRPLVISVVSSGTWGANDPGLSWLDIENLLARKGILDVRSIAASPGGEGDIGRGLSPAGRLLLDSAAARNRIEWLEAPTPEDAVKQRMARYRAAAGKPVRAFINVGDAPVNLGVGSKPLPTGVVDRRAADLPNPSVMRSMAEDGARLLNFRDVTRMAYRNRFPVAPVPLPALAKGRLFLEKRYPVGLAIAFAVIIVALLLVVIEFDLDYYVRGRGK